MMTFLSKTEMMTFLNKTDESIKMSDIESMATVNNGSNPHIKNNVMRHKYKELNKDEKCDMQTIKDMGLTFHAYLETIEAHAEKGSRELSLAKTKIEEAVMWAVKHITG